MSYRHLLVTRSDDGYVVTVVLNAFVATVAGWSRGSAVARFVGCSPT